MLCSRVCLLLGIIKLALGENVRSTATEREYVESYESSKCQKGQNCFRIGTLVSRAGETDGVFFNKKILAAITTAAFKGWEMYLRRLGMGVHLYHHVLKSPEVCSPVNATGIVAHAYYVDQISAVIGPSCSDILDHVAMLTAYWDLPTITGVGDHERFVDKTLYPTLTRFSYCQCQLLPVFTAIFQHFRWEHVTLIMDIAEYFSHDMGNTLRHGLLDAGYQSSIGNLELLVLEIDSRLGNNVSHFLEKAEEHSRVVILSVPGETLREFLLVAHAENRTNGDWVFLDIELFPSETDWGNKGWRRGDGRDEAAKSAYEALLRIRLPPQHQSRADKIATQMKEIALSEFNYTWTGELNYFIGSYYDGTMALIETVADFVVQNISIHANGRAITKAMWDRTYNGITGDFGIGAMGDRLTEFIITDLDPVDGEFKTVGNYRFKTDELLFDRNREIHWPHGRGPALDIPVCGFLREKCKEEPDVLAILLPAIGAFSFVLLSVVVGFLINRKIRMEKDLKNLHWRISWTDLIFTDQANSSSRSSLQNETPRSKSSPNPRTRSAMSSRSGGISRRAYYSNLLTGTYRGTRVAVKKFVETPVVLDRPMLLQMKNVSRLVHANIVPFLGASVELPNIAIVTELCERGSLNELLHDSNMELDPVFKMSLIRDIAKGLKYLHDSPIGCHGNLHPSNCLIDTRFVVMLSDFRLNGFLPIPKEEERLRNIQLYWAPESLRSEAPTRSLADIYSYGVILAEIIDREVPYIEDRATLDLETILHKVKAGMRPLMRPRIKYFSQPEPNGLRPELQEVLMDCLMEEPGERPSAGIVLKRLHVLGKGKELNIMDNLMKRMEEYTKNLENTVLERTAALQEQQDKMDDLLNQLLPQSVASQLLEGKTVVPQYFEWCSIYFSDIVGFTSLSSRSSPMEVVTLLNDLYGLLDELLKEFDCYKVETIGDAYMVVSGVPEENGNEHAREVALWALIVLHKLKSFKIQHMKDEKLRLRVGIHSGSVVAGVVGHRMPRYCLFGDTVNTSSRMESTGVAGKIQISEKTKTTLDIFKIFHTEKRGDQEVKGKGVMVTYWLLGTMGQLRGHGPSPLTSIDSGLIGSLAEKSTK